MLDPLDWQMGPLALKSGDLCPPAEQNLDSPSTAEEDRAGTGDWLLGW